MTNQLTTEELLERIKELESANEGIIESRDSLVMDCMAKDLDIEMLYEALETERAKSVNLESRLSRAVEGLKFYADKKNWLTVAFRLGYPMVDPVDVSGPGGLVGGKLARETLEAIAQKEV